MNYIRLPCQGAAVGLCNQLIALVNGILRAKSSNCRQTEITPFTADIHTRTLVPANKIFNLEAITGIKATPSNQRGAPLSGWYNSVNEQQFVNVLRSLKFEDTFYTLVEELLAQHINTDVPLHVIHFRIEQDGISHWSSMNKLPQATLSQSNH